ncbi:MAG: glycosyltransferase family 2 protein [Bacteroidaceae bacterium]|nr:glycosyltransferase family 2 protein [Bacteroidaceae bacterium]
MTEQPFFSIIIPVYNGVTNDLPICLDSIWNQPLDSSLYEVVCVDDCSTDNTRTYLKDEQLKHPNLKVIENERNIRQGGSRNKGVRAAKGRYIIFIDQDDYYHKESIAQVYNHLKANKLEILIVDCAYQHPGFESNKLQHNFPHREVMTGDEQIQRNSIPYAPWKFVFLRSLMIENGIFFAEHERIEDVDWVHALTHYAKRTQYQPILLIHYNKTSLSTTMTSYKSPDTVYSTLRAGKRLTDLATATFAESNDNVKKYIRSLGGRMYYIGIRSYFFFHDSIKEKSRNINETGREIESNSFLVRTAKKCPRLFSAITNVLSPAGNFSMYLYRLLKYRR